MKKYLVTLSEEERTTLNTIIGKRSEKAAIVKRAFALLAADTNGPNLADTQISERYHIAVRNLEKLRKRFIEQGFEDALQGRKRTIFQEKVHDGRVEAHLLALRCSEPPPGHNRWTLRLLADELVELDVGVDAVSYETVRQTLKKTCSSRT